MTPIDIVIYAQKLDVLRECIINLRPVTPGVHRLFIVFEEHRTELTGYIESLSGVTPLPVKQGASVAEAYNCGAAAGEAPLLVLMRDYMYVSEEWTERLSDCMLRHPGAGLAGPVSNGVSGLQHLSVGPAGPGGKHRLAEGLAGLRKTHDRKVPRLLGHCLMVRRDVFTLLGGFDERYAGESYEDDDLCLRALRAGYELYIADGCYVRYERRFGPGEQETYAARLAANRQAGADKWGEDLTGLLYAWKYPVTISLCMIVKNEEETLARCLSSVQPVVDEIVIVDTGSEDRTRDIASAYTGRIYDFEWIDDFSAARNFAFSKATQDYILWLDADDILQPEDAARLAELKRGLDWDADAVSMTYLLAFDDHGNVTSSLRRNRLVKREKQFRWVGAIHEYLEVRGKIVQSGINITHSRVHTQSSRNLHIFEKREAGGLPFSSRDLYYYANELFDHQQWECALRKYEAFLERGDGWVEDVLNAYGQGADCLQQLGELRRAKTMALASFAYALPRAENCCRLGYYHMLEEDYEGAAYWYEAAAAARKPAGTQAILRHACWTWLPHLQLCVCYHKLGRNEEAARQNEQAARFIPKDSRIVQNRTFFAGLGIQVGKA